MYRKREGHKVIRGEGKTRKNKEKQGKTKIKRAI